MLQGPQRSQVDLRFAIPSVCGQQVESGEVDLGLVPVAEIARQDLGIVPGVGIACVGAVRSILLFARTPWNKVRTLAVDSTSRTSVQLARIILRERYGVQPAVTPHPPDLQQMLSQADAALLIGDSALRLEPETSKYACLDLGQEWFQLTGLPMVFAAWAGKKQLPLETLSEVTVGSYRFGKKHLSDIIDTEYEKRGITRALAEQYLLHHIRYELGPNEMHGMNTFLELAALRPAALLASSC